MAALPDIAVTALNWNTLRDLDPYGGWRGIDITYRVDGVLPAGAELAFFWASGPNPADHIGDFVAERPLNALGGYYTVNDPALWGAPPAGTTHLVVMADPNNLIEESNENNNSMSLPLHTAAQILNGAVAASRPDANTVAAEFRPGNGQLTLSEAEVALGVHHFNWVSQSYLPSSMEVQQLQSVGQKILQTNPFLDPPASVSDLSQLELFSPWATPSTERFGAQAVDDKIFYWNEPDQYGGPAQNLDIRKHTSSQGLRFHDSPRMPDGFYGPGESTEFYVRLMGVSADGSPIAVGGDSWLHWSSNTTYQRSPGRGVFFISDDDDSLPPVYAGSVTAPESVTIESPIARDDQVTAGQHGPATVDVLANDRDPLGGSLRILEVGRAEHGTVQVSDRGTPDDPTDDVLLYVPNAGFIGEDRFQYVVARSQSFPGLAVAEVTIRVPGPLQGLAVAGDDLSDEYAGGPYDYARSWVELLAAKGVNLGAAGVYDAPRLAGYEYNWARTGATSETLLASGQQTGAAQQAAAGQANFAVLAIGQNDFAPGSAAFDGIYAGSWTDSQIAAYADGVVHNIDTALDTLLDSRASAVLVNLADPGTAPAARSAYGDAAGRDRVTQAVAAVNQRLRSLADQHRVPLVDAFGLSQALFGTNPAPIASQTIGGQVFVNQAGADPHNAFVGDGLHWHLAPQSVLGNLVLKAIDLGYGADVAPYWSSEAQTVQRAGLPYSGQDTLNLDYSTYVILPQANHSPVGVDDQYATDEGGSLDVPAAAGVLANDSDLDGQTLLAILLAGGEHGQVTLKPDGSFRYVPEGDYNGPDSFTYAIDDGPSTSPPVTVRLAVRPVNDPPAAQADAYATDEDALLVIDAAHGVLANDADVDGDPLTASLIAGPVHGMLTLNADGSFVYSPAKDYNGPDGFTYQARDASLSSNTVAVSLLVRSVNDPPAAQGDAYATNEDTPLTIDAAHGVLANDSDADRDAITAALMAGPAHGTLSFKADGSFVYSPAKDYNGPDSFTYRARDAALSSDTVTVSLTIRPVNDPPAAQGDAYTTDEDVPLAIDAVRGVLANDRDADGDALTAALVAAPAHGTLSLKADGSFAYSPAKDYSGPDSFTYRARDAAASSGTVTVSLLVRPLNDPPAAQGDAYTTDEDAPLAVDAARGVLANDRDVDGDLLTASLVAGPAHGTLSLEADGSFVYLPAKDYNGEDSFTYQARDAALPSGTVTVTFTIRPANDPPAAQGDAYLTDEDVPLVIDAARGVLANDTDVDGDPLAAVLVVGPSHGTLALLADGSLVYTPDRDYHGPDDFLYAADDGQSALLPVAVQLTVRSVVDAPDAADDTYFLDQGGSLAVDAARGVLANDSDPEGAGLTARWEAGPEHGRLTLGGDGSLQYTPDAGFFGVDHFTYRASGGGLSAPAVVTLHVARALGAVDYRELNGLSPSLGETWYRLQTVRAGTLTAEAAVSGLPGDARLTLWNASRQLLAASSVREGKQRLDYAAGAAGEVYYLRLDGVSDDVDLKLVNLVRASGTAVSVAGTPGNDAFTFTAAAASGKRRITVNGVAYEFSPSAAATISFDGGDDADSVVLTGGAGGETARLYSPGWTIASRLDGVGYSVTVAGTSKITVNGKGEDDTAYLYASPLVTDYFSAYPAYAVLMGSGYSNRVNNFRNVTAYATPGGKDVGYFYQSNGDDAFEGGPAYAVLSGDGFSNRGEKFRYVYARPLSSPAGRDTATLYGSAASDVLTATPEQVTFSNSSSSPFFLRIDRFGGVVADGRGGTDTAKLYDSSGPDTFEADPASARLFGAGFDNTARGFRSVTAYAAAGGADTARLIGSSTSADSYSATFAYDTLSGAKYSNTANGFETVEADGMGGSGDVARLYDSPAEDVFEAHPAWASLAGGGVSHRAANFPAVYAYANKFTGDADTALLYDSPGADTFLGYSNYARFYGPGFEVRPYYFGSVNAFSQNGGSDVAYLYDSVGDDTFESHAAWAACFADNGSFSNRVDGFAKVTATKSYGGRDRAHFYYASAADSFYGYESSSQLRSFRGDALQYQHTAAKFDEVFAHGADLGFDRGYLYDSSGSDALSLHDNEAMLTYASGRKIHLLDLSWVYAKSSAGADTKHRDPSTSFTLALNPARPWIDI